MTLRSWLPARFSPKTIVRPRRRALMPAKHPRLTLEVLKDRTLLSGTPSATLELKPASGSSLPAVTLALDSYQFGFENSAGTATFDDLQVTAPLNGESPLLFEVLASESHYDTALLTQRDGSGDPVAEWALDLVFITSDGIQNDSAATPTEELHFAFDALSEGTSANTASWSQVANTSTGPSLPGDLVDPPGPAAPPMTLELTGSTGAALTPVTLALDSYQFGFENPISIGPTGATAGTAKFDDLQVTAPLNGESPLLFEVLASESHYDTALLTQRDGSGDPVAEWALDLVFITSDGIQNDSAATPTEELHFAFDALSEGTSANTASWSQVANTSTGPSLPGDLVDPPGPAAPPMTLELTGSTGAALTPVTLALDSYQFGFENPISIGPTGATAGTAKFDDLQVTAPYGDASPLLFEVLASGSHYDTAVLTQQNGSGDPVAEWVLDTVFITSDGIQNDSADSAATPTEELDLAFGALTEVTSANTASWSRLTNTSTGPAAPAGVTLAALPGIMPTVTVTDTGGTYNGTAYPATATVAGVVAGVDNTPGSTLETVGLTLDYVNTNTNTDLGSTAPINAGDYKVTASFAGSADYLPASSSTTFVIGPATPTVAVSDTGGTYNGTAYPATATVAGVVAGVDNTPGSTLETVGLTLDYVNTNTNTDLGSTAPINAGDYKVTASFAGSADYLPASSSTTFVIAQHATTTTLAASTPEGAPGQSVTFTATVAGDLPSPYLPTGSVQFQVNGVGSRVPLTANDTAAFSTTEPASGSFTVTAVYSGDTNFAVSQSTYTESVLSPGVYAVGSTLYVGGANSSDYALISPYGSKLDCSTGLAVVATLNNAITAKAFSQTFTDIDVFGYGGNDVFLLIPTLTLPTTVVEGNGNNYLLLAGGNVSVTLGSGSNQVFGGNGNKTITASDPAGTSGYIFLGNGNENIQLGQGNDTVTVGNGNDNVQLGNGSDVIVEGNGNDYVSAGNGSDLVGGGLGQHTIQLRNGNDILIDGSATVVNSGDSLRQILSDWNKSSSALVNKRLKVVYNTSHPNVLNAGSGRDWWFYTYSKDMTNKKLTDRWN